MRENGLAGGLDVWGRIKDGLQKTYLLLVVMKAWCEVAALFLREKCLFH